MLAKAGLDAASLACGAHWPLDEDASRALSRSGPHAVAAAQQLLGQTRGLPLPRLRVWWDAKGYEQAAQPGPAGGQSGDRGGDRRGAGRGRLRHRRLFDSDLRRPAARVGVRLRVWRRRGLRASRAAAAKQILAAVAANPAMVAGEGAVRHRGYGAVRRAGLRQDGRRGGLLRGSAGARPRPCGQGRRRRDPRGAGDDRGADRPLPFRSMGKAAPTSSPSPRRCCATGTGSRSEVYGRRGRFEGRPRSRQGRTRRIGRRVARSAARRCVAHGAALAA